MEMCFGFSLAYVHYTKQHVSVCYYRCTSCSWTKCPYYLLLSPPPPAPIHSLFPKKFPVHSHRTDRFCYDPFLAFLKSFTSHPQVYTAHISKEYIQTFAKTLSPSPSSHKEGIGMDFICYLKLKNMRRIYEVTVFRDGTTG